MEVSGQHTTFLHLGILLFFAFGVSAQNNNSLQNVVGNLAAYSNTTAPEKVYLQTDKDIYTNGETIWFKAYLLNGITHTASTMSRVVYVELVDSKDNIITQKKLYAESLGAAGDITIPREIEEDTYVLRAYTKYMLNDEEPTLFQKEIFVSATQITSNDSDAKTTKKKRAKNKTPKPGADTLKQTKPIVQFFPEGGDLVIGIESVLGVKTTDSEGNGLALKGKILDQDSLLVSLFDSYEFGLGWSSLEAKPNTDYYLQIPFDDTMVTYPVPKPVPKGYALRVMNRGEYVTISACTNIANGLQGALLIGHIRGDVIFKQALKSNGENSNIVKLLTSKLPDGIAHFTLFAPNGEPVSERLTFIENPKNDLELLVKTETTDYGLREKVNVAFALIDDKGKPLDGDLSMSVFTKNEMQKDADNIKSWLLLNSDLGGTIANPNYFFQEDVKGREYLLDLLMLTHGWRRFTWKSIRNDRVRKQTSFPPEKGIMINGTTTAFNNKYQPKKARTTLNIVANELIQEKQITNVQGRFSFGPFIFMDSITAVINASNLIESKKNKDRLAIQLDPQFPQVNVKNTRMSEGRTKKVMSIPKKPYPVSKVAENITSDFEYDPNVTYLEEAVVTEKKPSKQELLTEKLNTRTLYGEPSNRLIPDSIPGLGNGAINAFNVLRSVPGIRVFGTFPNQEVFIRPKFGITGDSPLYLLDGVPVSAGQIQSIRVSDILFIDVLKGADASIYGGRASGGVVAVYMKTGEEIVQKPKAFSGVINVIIPGFYKAREFYKPNYAIAKPEHKKPDYRSTLHWEPNIEINDNSASQIDFYTGDIAGQYMMRVEGMTSDGRPVNELYSFNVLN